MRRFEFEGLVGDVVGKDCKRRMGTRCWDSECDGVACAVCLYYPPNLDTFRRWEAAGCPVGTPDLSSADPHVQRLMGVTVEHPLARCSRCGDEMGSFSVDEGNLLCCQCGREVAKQKGGEE